MSVVRELANAIQIITGAVNTIRLVYKAYEAIKDVDQQINHLISVCNVVEKHLSETRGLLRQRQRSPNQDEKRMEYYSSVARLVTTVDNDLKDVERTITRPDGLPKPKMLARVFRSRPYKATDLALNLNENAMKRIETASIHLQWATSNLWRYERESPGAVDQDYFSGLRNLSQKIGSGASAFSSDFEVMTPSLDVSDPNSKDRAEEYLRDIRQLNDSAFEIFEEVVVRTLHSGTQTPVEGWALSPVSEQPTLLELPPPETHVTLEELRLRYNGAKKLAELASDQEFPDAAANYHAKAIKCHDELSKAGEPNKSVKTKLESNHIGILIKCFRTGRREEGIERLNKLAKEAKRLEAADPRELDASDLHRLRRDIGDLYLKLQMWAHAEHFLRLAIFEPTFSQNYPSNKEEAKSIAWGIIQAYKHSSRLIEVEAFREMLVRHLKEDPTVEPQEYRDTIAWCRKNNFDVDEMSTPPCLNKKDADGDFPLHKAVCDPHVSQEVLRQLASDRNVINARGKNKMTPLLMAVIKGRLAAVQVLLEEGANLDLRTPETDMVETVLHVCKDVHIMRLLLEKIQSRRPSIAPSIIPQQIESPEDPQHIDINSQSPYIGTALHHACERDDWPIVEVLLAYGADPNAENYIRETPLILTCFNKGTRISTRRIVRALLNHGANVDHRDDYQRHAQDGLEQKRFSPSDIRDLLQPMGLRSGSSSLRRGTETDSMASARHLSIDSLGLFSEASRDGSST
ncbi:unnamed protein product [Clonostachys chloroleuca]|uniref:Ankyrin repeat protein n=1 Tax=Clonostachys chloroleuca TaxID=1926264 RepID=A0AA35PYU9_9HYPO|nr:unnamed protein product [Clonostachys chloroleuca]